ncbi:uncharacterized protein C1orf159 homolog isoform X12 [Equus przewalskii]|uniref:Uncharacterized protein C1orf159 homolog isoform X12 n=1 Tax=Equus przewalskii TaxID=9798 RepID=A0ABM4NA88_EQUPR|nr:uncharacterized protein C1orf159 homolog isoform X7 [Equus caballus]
MDQSHLSSWKGLAHPEPLLLSPSSRSSERLKAVGGRSLRAEVCGARGLTPGSWQACPDSDHRPERIWMSAAHVLEGQTLCSRTWHSSAPFSWPASWWKLPASPQTVRASSLSVVWTWWTSMPPAQAQACVAQAATGTGTRTGASAVSSAGTEPTTVPSAEAGALKWQPPCSWGHSSSARASSSPWPGSSTSSVPVGSPGSSTGETKSLPCSLEKLLR